MALTPAGSVAAVISDDAAHNRAFWDADADLLELRPPKGATTTFGYVPYSWARRRPAEQIWRVRKGMPA